MSLTVSKFNFLPRNLIKLKNLIIIVPASVSLMKKQIYHVLTWADKPLSCPNLYTECFK